MRSNYNFFLQVSELNKNSQTHSKGLDLFVIEDFNVYIFTGHAGVFLTLLINFGKKMQKVKRDM